MTQSGHYFVLRRRNARKTYWRSVSYIDKLFPEPLPVLYVQQLHLFKLCQQVLCSCEAAPVALQFTDDLPLTFNVLLPGNDMPLGLRQMLHD
ncbi:MAG TPA: hypothetical protein VKG24_00365 [Pseudolabrys sp.]|nr:hypothetical protein [Pseudolabrys sp.]